MDFCCTNMSFFLEENKVDIYYDFKFRSFAIGMKNGTTAMQLINYCPWCGAKLPTNLRDKWFDLLEEAYQIEFPFNGDQEKIPEEFRTDEWWKKRGL